MATYKSISLTVNLPWMSIRYTLPRGTLDLIALASDTQLGYFDNEVMDGYRDAMPDEAEFVDMMYDDIVNGATMPVILGGSEVDVSFGDDVRFLTADIIKSEIRSVYINGSFGGAEAIEKSAVKIRA